MLVGTKTSIWQDFRSWWKYTAEDEFFHRMLQNPVYPFQDLGNGLYCLQCRSGRMYVGITILSFTSLFLYSLFTYIGFHEVPVFIMVCGFIVGFYVTFGSILKKELIVSRMEGYVFRCALNQRILTEQKIYNVYIRLEQIIDSSGCFHYFICCSGYLIEEVRLSRLSRSEVAMRLMAKKLARNLGINYFDIYDHCYDHVIFHTRGCSNLPWKDSDIETVYQQPERLCDPWGNPYNPEGPVTLAQIRDMIERHHQIRTSRVSLMKAIKHKKNHSKDHHHVPAALEYLEPPDNTSGKPLPTPNVSADVRLLKKRPVTFTIAKTTQSVQNMLESLPLEETKGKAKSTESDTPRAKESVAWKKKRPNPKEGEDQN